MILRAQETKAWYDIVTLDQSRFSDITDHELILLTADGKVSHRERPTVHSRTLIPTILWDPTGFAVVTALDMGANSTRSIM
jgi:hypothetical protein